MGLVKIQKKCNYFALLAHSLKANGSSPNFLKSFLFKFTCAFISLYANHIFLIKYFEQQINCLNLCGKSELTKEAVGVAGKNSAFMTSQRALARKQYRTLLALESDGGGSTVRTGGCLQSQVRGTAAAAAVGKTPRVPLKQ